MIVIFWPVSVITPSHGRLQHGSPPVLRSRREPPAREDLLLGLQVRGVLVDEASDVVRHREQLQPLLLVERHREAAETVYGYAALLAHLQGRRGLRSAFEGFVLSLQAFELGAELSFGAHGGVLLLGTRSLARSTHKH